MCYQTKCYAMFCVIRQKAMQCFSFVIRQKAMQWFFVIRQKAMQWDSVIRQKAIQCCCLCYQTKGYALLIFVLSDKRLCNVVFPPASNL